MPCRDDGSGTALTMDVGGTVYSVSRAVLMSVPNSWLARLANGAIQLPRTAQEIRFIDRDAQARPPASLPPVEKYVVSLSQMIVSRSRKIM